MEINKDQLWHLYTKGQITIHPYMEGEIVWFISQITTEIEGDLISDSFGSYRPKCYTTNYQAVSCPYTKGLELEYRLFATEKDALVIIQP